MEIKDLKAAMWNNSIIRYQGGLYEISAAVFKFDREKQRFYYQLELKDIKADSSLVYCRIEEAELTELRKWE